MTAPSIPQTIQLDFVFPAPEEWRPVVGWEGLYEVSNLGRVRSLDRRIPDRYHTIGISKKGRLLKLSLKSLSRQQRSVGITKKYVAVYLSISGKGGQKLVHHLVLDAFVGLRPEGFECNHIDGNKTNNNVANLEWVSRQQNSDHALQKGLRKVHGEYSGSARFTDEEILRMRQLAKSGMVINHIAKIFKVKHSYLQDIIRGKNWKHLPM
jgi:hypothetical protein